MTYTETARIADGEVAATVWPRSDLSFDLDADGRVLAVHRINDEVRARDLEDVIRELRHVDGEPVVEHAVRMADGSMQVRNSHPRVEEVFPLADWIRAGRLGGGKVYRRRVVVVEDWAEVER